MHNRLLDWEACRSGAGMTITGKGQGGGLAGGIVKISNVKKIVRTKDGATAILATGHEIALS